ncbi:MAG: hypothetical protein AB1601_13335 [Planctomycetota bacterium]
MVVQRARAWLRRANFTAAAACLAVAIAGLTVVAPGPTVALVVTEPPPPNDPIGVALGIHPGRVVWVHNPKATDWEGTNYEGENIGDGYWWESSNTDQAAVDAMLSRAIRGLAGEATDASASNAIFRHFNRRQGHGDVGYQPGQKITIKANLVTANRIFSYFDPYGNQTARLGWVNTSPLGTFYNPDGSGIPLPSLGVHKHWNDPTHKQYSRNLGTGDGIELIHVSAHRIGDLNCDDHVDFGDINPFVMALTNPARYQATYPDCNRLNGDCNGDARADFGDINPFVRLLANP